MNACTPPHRPLHSPRHRPADLPHWDREAIGDIAWSNTARYRRMLDEAETTMARWARGKRGYVGVSWGKDSTVLASLAQQIVPEWPLVTIWHKLTNPDCSAVRHAFMKAHPRARCVKVWVDLEPNNAGGFHLSGSLERGFAEAVDMFGHCYFFGIRAEESGDRRRYLRVYGQHTIRTCAPLINWKVGDIWACLAANELPVHPIYAMNFNGAIPRDMLRMSAMTSHKHLGDKTRHENAYYPEFREFW